MPSHRKVFVSQEAADDLRAIGHDTEATWGVDRRDQYLDELVIGIRSLVETPMRGSSCENPLAGARKLRINRHIVYSLVDERRIVVVRILHHKTDDAAQFD